MDFISEVVERISYFGYLVMLFDKHRIMSTMVVVDIAVIIDVVVVWISIMWTMDVHSRIVS